MAKDSYIEAVGRRKTARARTRIVSANKTKITILQNVDGKMIKKKFEDYFPTEYLRDLVLDVFKTGDDAPDLKFEVTSIIKGGGISAQAQALRHGIARALVKYDDKLRTYLKKRGFLKRDARSVERKKFGLKKARRAPQWSKR